MENLLGDYERSLKARGIKTREAYLVSIREYLDFLMMRNLEPLNLPSDFGDEYRSYLFHQEKPQSRRTINNKLTRVKGLYRSLEKKGVLYFNPFEETAKLKVGRILPKNIHSVEQIGTLLDDFALRKPHDYMYRVMVEILYGSALRIREAEALTLDDIDVECRIFTIQDFKTERIRKVPATEMSLKRISEYLKEYRPDFLTADEMKAGYLFPQRGKTTFRCTLNRKLKTECLRLGLPVITSHSLRHTAATHMLKSGAGIRQVQAFLGHESILTTQVYTHIVTDDLKMLVADYHPRENGV